MQQRSQRETLINVIGEETTDLLLVAREIKLKEMPMSFGDVISTKTTQEGDQTVFSRITEGWNGEEWSHTRTWTRVHGWHCPKCGESNLVATKDVSEYGAGYQHICLSCGFGFMFDGDEYLDISEKSRDTLVAYYNERKP